MLSIDYLRETGWQKPQIVSDRTIQLEKSPTTMRGGVSVQEGISVVKNRRNGKLQAFRAKESMKTFLESSEYMDLPHFDTDELLNCIKELAVLNKDQLCDNDKLDQLYTRMVHFSTDKTTGAHVT